MSEIEERIERYRQAREEQKNNDDALKMNLVFGAGVLFGSDYPGASAGVILALERMFPNEEWPDIGGDGSNSTSQRE